MFTGCGGSTSRADGPAIPEIDVARGTYGNVRVGDPPSAVFASMGRSDPAREGEPATPLGVGDYSLGPPVIDFPDREEPPEMTFYRYETAVFSFLDRELLFFSIEGGAARTTRGVAIGDALAEARGHYPEMACGRAYEGTEYGPKFPACRGRSSGGTYYWFGGDPIKNITVSSAPIQAP